MEAVAFPNHAPSVCFLCEGVPPATAFVDTLREFRPPSVTQLNGRKYVCENCIADAAAALDLFEEAKAPLQVAVDELTAQVAQLQEDNDSYAAIKAAVEQLSSRPVVQLDATVEQAVEKAKTKRATRSKAAADVQDALKAEQDAADAGAALQIQQDAEYAAKQAQQVEVPPPAVIPTGPTAPADPPLGPVTPVGQNEGPPIPGQVWLGDKWVDPPVDSVTVLPNSGEPPAQDAPEA